MIRRILFVLIVLSCWYSTSSFAQNGSLHTTFLAIDSLYNAGSYLGAEVEARRLLEYANLTDTAYAEIHKYIAFSLIAQGKSGLAKERFAMLLSLYPTYSLDPMLTSPKILVIFNEAKRAFESSQKPIQEAIKSPIEVDGSPISFRSILFPGWEQLYRGRKMPGTLFHPDVYNLRPRLCDLGFLRRAYRSHDGSIGYRCPAEPVADFLRKGGLP